MYSELDAKSLNFEPIYKYYKPSELVEKEYDSRNCVSIQNENFCTIRSQRIHDISKSNQNSLSQSDSLNILRENLRQKCIWNLHQSEPLIYWKYMIGFYDMCVKTKMFNEKCSNEVKYFIKTLHSYSKIYR